MKFIKRLAKSIGPFGYRRYISVPTKIEIGFTMLPTCIIISNVLQRTFNYCNSWNVEQD